MAGAFVAGAARFKNVAGVIAAVALAALMVALLAGAAPAWFGYQSLAVFGGSMQPAMHVGDLAIVAPVQAQDLHEGDIITYRLPEKADTLVTHRIVQVEVDQSGHRSFITRGDANNTTDQVAVEGATVLGKVVAIVPKLGYLVDFSRRTEGKVLLVGFPALLLLVLDGVSLVRRRKDAPPAGAVAGALVEQAEAAARRGDLPAALALSDRAIAADPHAAAAWIVKAECLTDPAEALACLQAGATVNPQSDALRQAIAERTGAARSAL